MNKSESIVELAAALAKAQAKIEGAVKDKSNPAFRSKYADLGACWDAIRGPLTENGLSVVQFPRTLDGAVEVETILMHATGQYISDVFAIPVSKRDAHGYMSATTYARRGALMAVAGIAPVDDDGNGATERPAKPPVDAPRDIPAEDAGLLVNGEKRSSYAVNKENKYDEWVSRRKEELGGLLSEDDINEWWGSWGVDLGKLQKHFPEKHKDLWLTVERHVDAVRRTPQGRH